MTLRIELHKSDTASCDGLSVTYIKGPIGRLARKLADVHPEDTPVEVWRGDTLCFAAMPLRKWAGLSVSEPSNASVRVVKYQPFDWSVDGAPEGHTAPERG